MVSTPKMKEIYSEIQKKIFYMIPEKWEKIYLYASVIENINYIETGEMFLYYFPKGILKKNPINIYEVPAKFNIEEQAYMELAENLYDTIKKLREEFRKNGLKMWSNITISIENSKFTIEFHYENLFNNKYDSYDRHLIWKYLYLNEPIEKLSKKEKKMIQEYLLDQKFKDDDTYKYQENIYDKESHNVIEYNKDYRDEINYDEEELNKIINKYEIKERKNKKGKQKEEQQENLTGKNQILNM